MLRLVGSPYYLFLIGNTAAGPPGLFSNTYIILMSFVNIDLTSIISQPEIFIANKADISGDLPITVFRFPYNLSGKTVITIIIIDKMCAFFNTPVITIRERTAN